MFHRFSVATLLLTQMAIAQYCDPQSVFVPWLAATGSLHRVVTADIHGDCDIDFAVSSDSNEYVRIFEQLDDATFARSRDIVRLA